MDYGCNLVLEYILSQQDEEGKFPTYKINPVQLPDQKKKLIPDPSPFITANIVYSLHAANVLNQHTFYQKANHFLISQMEQEGYWRFWRFRSKQHTFPFDTDDTGICSFVLNQFGYKLRNKDFLEKNTDFSGYFYTWLIPTFKNLISSPIQSISISKAYLKGFRRMSFFNRNQEHFLDKEPAIAANLILYLGETEKTKRCINQIIHEIQINEFPMNYYMDEFSVYYHIARAYRNGISSFHELGEIICNRVSERVVNDKELNDLNKVMAANILLDYKTFENLSSSLINSIVNCERFPDKWEADTYFCGKQRIFQAGSPVLTAALLVEAMAKLNRNEK